MNPRHGLPLAVFLVMLFLAAGALAQTCPDTNPETDSQIGCPDNFYTAVSKPAVRRGLIEFNVTVKNRRIVFPPNCNPGDQFCYDNLNYQGLPLCNSDGWSGKFKDVKVELASCYPDCDLQGCPDCDFNITVTPSKAQTIENEKFQNYTVRINTYNTMGDYDFTFSAFLSSVKKRIFSFHLNISSQPPGTGGDNALCPVCASQKCDIQRPACGDACKGAVYCSGPECFFDTPFSESAESCCGDDTGEIFRQCSKTKEIDWNCPFQAACCGQGEECVYSGKCYQEGIHMLTAGEDEYAYCKTGTWHGCDESPDICSGCGFSWNNSECCGDDSDEYFRSRICLSGCETNMTDRSCCTMGSACIYNGQCYATGALIALGKKNITCAGGTWYEKTSNQSSCYKGECNKKDRCEGACPACIFKDFSCYGTNCEADYIDPDMHWTYCQNCSVNWSLAENACCGDDEKEYWVSPCPNANVSWKCCSNPNERVNSSGECVISCGIAVNANAAELEERLIPLTISLSPEFINVNAGKTAEFRVMLRTDGNRSLHGLTLNLCGPFTFEVSPKAIDELKPGDTETFTVKMTAAPDSLLGTLDFAAYVSSSELIRQRYKPGLVNIGMADYPSYDVYLAIVFAMAGIYIVKKLLSRRRSSAKKAKPGKESTSASRQSRKDAALRDLAELIREELDKGTPEKELMSMLISSGLKKKDVEAAFEQAKKKNS